LKRRFSLAAMDRDWPWYVVEYQRALAALGEYDLESASAWRGRSRLGQAVFVDGMGEGVVTGFAECGRIEVSIARYPRGVLTTYAPRAHGAPAVMRQHDLVQRRDSAGGTEALEELMRVQIECAARGHVFIPRIPVQRVDSLRQSATCRRSPS
jgi:hypothetical protein